MTETITIDGKDYEVLTLDRIGEITHAKLAGGKVVAARLDECQSKKLEFISFVVDDLQEDIFVQNLNLLGIQPLKLIDRVPVEFVATFAKIGHEWHPVYNLDEGLAQQGREQKVFRCTEVTK